MARDPRYDILFEPVQIGPVTAKNRFYQVPHPRHRPDHPRGLQALRARRVAAGPVAGARLTQLSRASAVALETDDPH